MSTDLFARLIDVMNVSGFSRANNSAARWIKKHSDEDADLMSKADILEVCHITRHIRASLLVHGEEHFLCVVGLEANENLPDGFDVVELTPGFFALAVIELKLMSTATSLEIFQVIGSDFAGEDGYEGHDLGDIAKLFPTVSVFQLNRDADSAESIWRSLGILLATNYGQGPIELGNETLKALLRLYESASPYVPFRNIVQGHLAMSWSGLFLELYRAIEQLYIVPKISNLIIDWASEKPFYELAEILSNTLGWRPKEEDALRDLIYGCEGALIDALAAEFSPEAEKKSQGAAHSIYKQRNSLVHFRQDLTEQELAVDQWNGRVSRMIELVGALYAKHGESYMKGREKPCRSE